jgi:hypothetical protein
VATSTATLNVHANNGLQDGALLNNISLLHWQHRAAHSVHEGRCSVVWLLRCGTLAAHLNWRGKVAWHVWLLHPHSASVLHACCLPPTPACFYVARMSGCIVYNVPERLAAGLVGSKCLEAGLAGSKCSEAGLLDSTSANAIAASSGYKYRICC